MLENRSFVLLTFCINYVCTEYKIYSDGWIPVPSDQVYNQIRRDFRYPTYEATSKKAESIKLFHPQLDSKAESKENPKTSNSMNTKIPPQINLKYEIYEDVNPNFNTKYSQRKAKKMLNPTLIKQIDAFFDEIKEPNDKRNTIEDLESLKSDTTLGYEVTEAVKDLQDSRQDSSNGALMHNYRLASIENPNLSSKFINILSKYNIKTDDTLKNYDLSRLIKTQIPYIAKYRKTWDQYRHNNLNLPVDPLLAVFLSNYGFYIPSLHRINTNHNNLYGYLSSDNIHINQPFGLYKFLSDTDSWN